MDDRYREYLQSDWWKKTRDECIERAGNKCECCGKTFDLQVHHLTYAHLGFERDYEIMCLCRNCHAWIEDIKQYSDGVLEPKAQRDYLLQRSANLNNNSLTYLKTKEEINNDFIQEYKLRDYAFNGDLNLTNLEVMRENFQNYCKKNHYSEETVCACTKIQHYFRNRRYEVILSYMNKKYPIEICMQRTKILPHMIRDIYKNPQKAIKLLEQEGKNYAETNRI